MGLRGPKPSITNIGCPNENCERFGKTNAGNIVSNGTYPTKNGRLRKLMCRACGAVFCERKSTAFYDIRSHEEKVILAIKLILQGMSLRAVSNVLQVKLDTVRFWLTRAATHAEQVNEVLLKEITVNKVELDELWSFVRKKNFRDWQKGRKKTMAHAGSGSPWHRNTD